LRFFIREDVSEKRRYTALDDHFVANGMQSWVSRSAWVDDAIRVNGLWWPMVRMDWVEGVVLDTHVHGLTSRSDPTALVALASAWRARVHQLQKAEFAHGDLQHGNVLVDPSGSPRLVDFDGSWIAAFDGFPPPRERGSPNYQHVRRRWGRWMDTFPALVIYTGLLALSRRPDAWRNNEGILLTHEDLARPGATPTWALLAQITDAEIRHAVERLQSACRPEWQPDGSLEKLLGPERVTVSGAQPFILLANPDPNWYLDMTGARPTDAAQESEFRGVSDPAQATVTGLETNDPHPPHAPTNP
jgi:hypothetical protein